MRVSFHVKTNLTYDGRVLASIDAIGAAYPESDIRISLLPDGPTRVELPSNAWIDEIIVPVRGNRFKALLRLITVIWYTIVDLKRTIQFRPDVIHIHDKTAAFAPFLYQLFARRPLVLIYDDHEIFNKPHSIADFFFWHFEKMIAKSADAVVVANHQRGRLLKKLYFLDDAPTVVENFYYDRSGSQERVDVDFEKTGVLLKRAKAEGKRLLLHQGRILEERGQSFLESIPSTLPEDWILCIIGVSKHDFVKSELSNRDNVLFLGKIQFEFLPKVYSYMSGATIFYLPRKLNNRYCAPNRLYQAISFGLPIIVNANNPVLSDIVNRYKNGVSLVEDSLKERLEEYFLRHDELKVIANTITEDFDFRISAEKYVSLYRKSIKN